MAMGSGAGRGWTLEVVGHRGYGDAAADNSLEGFELAHGDALLGGVEFDVQPTSDGVLTVAHDSVRELAAGDVEAPRLADVLRVVLRPRGGREGGSSGGSGEWGGGASRRFLELEIEIKGQVGASDSECRARDDALVEATLQELDEVSREVWLAEDARGGGDGRRGRGGGGLQRRLEALVARNALASFSAHVRADVLQRRRAWLRAFGALCAPSGGRGSASSAWPAEVQQAFEADEVGMSVRFLGAHLAFVALESRPFPGAGFASYSGLLPFLSSSAWLQGLRTAREAPFRADAVGLAAALASFSAVRAARAAGIEVRCFFFSEPWLKVQRVLGREEDAATLGWLQRIGVTGVCVNSFEVLRGAAPAEAAAAAQRGRGTDGLAETLRLYASRKTCCSGPGLLALGAGAAVFAAVAAVAGIGWAARRRPEK